jgi:hypothetical protein
MGFGAPSLALAKSFLLAQMTVCPLPSGAPHVDIIFLNQKPVYVTEAPIDALTAEMRNNPDSTFASDSRWIVYGMTVADVGGGQFHVAFDTLTDEAGNTCLAVHKVDFILRYAPTVFLAKELQKYDCRLHMTRLHEERHVATDIRTIKEYKPKIEMDLLWYLRSLGMQGPFPAGQAPKAQQEIVNQIVAAAKPMIDKLVAVRRDRQSAIDTIENYRQEAALCPGEFPQSETDADASAGGASKP